MAAPNPKGIRRFTVQKTYQFTRPLSASADDAWAVLSSLDTVSDWLPVVTTARVDASGDQPIRYCDLANGFSIEERITEVDAERRVLGYTIYKGLPADSYKGIFAIVTRDDGASEVRWTIDVEAAPEVVAQFDGMLSELAPSGLQGLDAAAAQRAAA